MIGVFPNESYFSHSTNGTSEFTDIIGIANFEWHSQNEVTKIVFLYCGEIVKTKHMQKNSRVQKKFIHPFDDPVMPTQAE